MDKTLTPLPTWIKKTNKGYFIPLSMTPLQCSLCNYCWYPKINADGSITLPVACASTACRTGAWRKIRK